MNLAISKRVFIFFIKYIGKISITQDCHEFHSFHICVDIPQGKILMRVENIGSLQLTEDLAESVIKNYEPDIHILINDLGPAKKN